MDEVPGNILAITFEVLLKIDSLSCLHKQRLLFDTLSMILPSCTDCWEAVNMD